MLRRGPGSGEGLEWLGVVDGTDRHQCQARVYVLPPPTPRLLKDMKDLACEYHKEFLFVTIESSQWVMLPKSTIVCW